MPTQTPELSDDYVSNVMRERGLGTDLIIVVRNDRNPVGQLNTGAELPSTSEGEKGEIR